MPHKTLMTCLAATTALTFPATGRTDEAAALPDDLEEIVVTIGKAERKLEDVVGSIAVITSEDIASDLTSDMSQLFRYEPGITVTGSAGQAQNVVVRGMGGDRVLMIKDGMRLNEGYGADGLNDIVGRGFLDVDSLKQVEVAKGPASSLYGADAMGGIVVFTTKDAADYLGESDYYIGGKVGYDGRSDEISYGATLAGRLGRSENMVSVTRRDGSETRNFNDSRVPLEVDSLDIIVKSRLLLADENHIQVTYNRYTQDTVQPDTGGGHGLWRDLAGYQITRLTDAEDKLNQSFKVDLHLEGGGYKALDIGAYHNRTRQDNDGLIALEIDSPYTPYKGPRDMWTLGHYEQKTFGVVTSLVMDITTGGLIHELVVGGDVEKTSSERTTKEYRTQGADVIKDETSYKFPKNDVLRTGIYINDYVKLSERVTANGGLRFDYTKMTPGVAQNEAGFTYAEISDSKLSANLGVDFAVTETISLVASYAQGFKTPPYDLAYIYHDNSIYGYKLLPTDDLSPETSQSFEVGLKVDFDRLQFSVFGFHSLYDDFITVEKVGEETSYPYGPTIPVVVSSYQYRNIDRVKIQGLEAKVTYQVTDEVELFANISYQDGKDRDSNSFITSIDPLSGLVGGAYKAERWGVEALLNWAKAMTKVNEGQFVNPGYQVVDLTAYAELYEGVVLRAGVFNVLDTEYTTYKAVAGAAHTDNIANRTSPGRSLSAKLSFAL